MADRRPRRDAHWDVLSPVTPLGQEEIFTPPPTRKLIVPSGATSWWGIDPSTMRVAIATVTADGQRSVSTNSFAREDGGRRLASIFWGTAALARQLVHDARPARPGVIVVEQPSGKQPNPALSYAVGATIAGCFQGINEVTFDGVGPHDVPMPMVSSSTWKRVACGAGNIYKPKPTSKVAYGVLTWARQHGYSGSSWDEADAWAIAEYARRTYALEQR